MVKESAGDRLFDIINYFLLAIVLTIVLYPLIFVAVASISNPAAVVKGQVWLLPKDINFTGYEKVFANKEF
ncbi:ABC-type maltose transport systems, permease component [Actinobacillus pleuropneumoniae]|nr:ABC-type maltose transport systems, permease component [Actinobacillus pleuropneumoniae]